MGVVHTAECNRTGIIYALKLLKPEKEHKGLAEARALRACSGNPHVLDLHEVFLGGSQKALVCCPLLLLLWDYHLYMGMISILLPPPPLRAGPGAV